MKTPLRIDVWSDIACPWCFIAKRRLEAALARIEAADKPASAAKAASGPGAIQLHWRAFELDPSAPKNSPDRTYAERLARKYHCSIEEGQAMIDRMVETGRLEGLELRFDRIRPTNTFDAHRLLAWSAGEGRQTDLKECLLRAYMSEGADLGDDDVLVGLSEKAGLDPGNARSILDGDDFAGAVRWDEDNARQAGITGVPFFVIGGQYALSGAQPVEVMMEAIERARAETTEGSP